MGGDMANCKSCGKEFVKLVGWIGNSCPDCMDDFNRFIERRKKELGLTEEIQEE